MPNFHCGSSCVDGHYYGDGYLSFYELTAGTNSMIMNVCATVILKCLLPMEADLYCRYPIWLQNWMRLASLLDLATATVLQDFESAA